MRTFSTIIILIALACSTARSQVTQGDSLALIAIYNSLNGPNWKNNANWLQGSVGTWHGITVLGGRVTKLALYNNGLIGVIPGEINDLDALKEINLGSNVGLRGPLPSMDKLKDLTSLILYEVPINTQFPEELSALTNLEILDLTRTGIAGPIPSSVTNLQRLTFFSASENPLNVPFPDIFLDLPQLEALSIYGCGLTGPLPDLSSLTKLIELTIGGNPLNVPFPEWIVHMDSLQSLNLQQSGLYGNVPDSLFSRLHPDLRVFSIGDNDLEGDVARFLTEFKPKLNRLDLPRNRFYGSIPEGVIDISAMYRFSVSGNQLIGLPDFKNIDHSMNWFNVEDNKLGFEELEKCLDITTFQPAFLTLGPQKKLLTPDTIFPSIGDQIIMESGSGGAFSQYQWFFNGEEISGATESSYEIRSIQSDQFGVYHCVVRNTNFEFDLFRHDISLLQPVGTHHYDDHLDIQIFPNPANEVIQIKSNEGVIEYFEVMDLQGKVFRTVNPQQVSFIISTADLTPGLWIVRYRTGDKSGSTRILVN